MKIVRTALLVTGLLALFACASTPEPETTPAPPPPEPAREAPPMPAAPPKDHCEAYKFQYLVGKPKSEIPVPVDPTKRRVACTSCPVTMDYREDRLNIFFDAETGVIKDVKCG
jgi:hypothetical protein